MLQSGADLTPHKAGDEHASAGRNGRNHPKSTSTGNMMGLVRAAAAVRRSKKDGLARRSGENRGEFGPATRVSAGSVASSQSIHVQTTTQCDVSVAAAPRCLCCWYA